MFGFLAASYIIGILATIFLVLCSVFTLISVDEIKVDHRDPIAQCQLLNMFILPEYVLHSLITLLFLFGGSFLVVLFNLPLIVYHASRYLNRPVMSEQGIYDPTTIVNASEIKSIMTESWIKLLFYSISFLLYMICMIMQLVAD
ncbi:hypothetical protein ACOME3_002932 [Neoechinorhynchus agilis]